MVKKVLIGVRHDNLRERELVLGYLRSRTFTSVGLELCQDFRERMVLGANGYFYEFVKSFDALKKEVIPLENRDLLGDIASVSFVWDCYKKEGSRPSVKARIDILSQRSKEVQGSFKETAFQRDFSGRFFSDTYASFEKYPCFEELDERFRYLNRRREDYILERILDTAPDVVILGFVHVDALEEQLFNYSSFRVSRNSVLPVSLYRLGKTLTLLKD